MSYTRYPGNYLGLVVNTEDPERRGRVQIFVPEISTTLYTKWNERLEDISFKSFTSDVFDTEIRERLLSLLPWAEAAVPCWGGSTGAPIDESTGLPVPMPTNQAFSYSGKYADYSGLFKSGVTDANLQSHVKERLSAFAGEFPNAVITSAYRSASLNQSVGGSQGSQHTQGNAIDVRMPSDPREQQRIVDWWATVGGASGIGWEGDHIHIDFRSSGRVAFGPDYSTLNGTPSWFQSFGTAFRAGSYAGSSQPSVQDGASTALTTGERKVQEFDGLNNTEGKNEGTTVSIDTLLGGIKNNLGAQSNQLAQNAAAAYATAYSEAIRNGASPTQAHIVASAIVGNMAQESGFDVNKVHDGGIGFGLLGENQDILQRMLAYAASKGETRQTGISPQTQVEALFREKYFIGPNARNGGFLGLLSSPDVASAARLFATGYLLPAAATANYANRQNKAIAAATTLGNSDALGAVADSGINIIRTTTAGQNAYAPITAPRIGGQMGFYSTPAVGAKVWVFFYAENPQRPVYFATAYEPSNVI